jgi:hypothetical protein
MFVSDGRVVVACGFLLLAAGCAKEQITINLRSVLDEAAENELAPTVRLADKDIIIEGVVARTGLKTEWAREGSAHSAGFGVVKGESHSVGKQVLFAVIEPGDGKPGGCMCFFDSIWIEPLASYKPKSRIRVLAQFQRFLRQGEHEVLAADCSLLE